jgi:hypothetical protein
MSRYNGDDNLNGIERNLCESEFFKRLNYVNRLVPRSKFLI